jgi:hypothetical protein
MKKEGGIYITTTTKHFYPKQVGVGWRGNSQEPKTAKNIDKAMAKKNWKKQADDKKSNKRVSIKKLKQKGGTYIK